MSDTFKFEMTGDSRHALEAALGLLNHNVTGIVQFNNSLLLEYEHDRQRLCFRAVFLCDAIMDWLGRGKGSNPAYLAPEYGPQPDIDGDCKRGWRIEADKAVVRIHPQWMVYHK